MYRDKWYSIVNIGGLAIGMCIALLLTIYVKFELSFDRFHDDYKRIYRLNTHFNQEGKKEERYPATLYEAGEAIRQNIPEVETLTRLYYSTTGNVSIGEEVKNSQTIIYTDSSFFSLFKFPIVMGNSKNPLAEPNQIVITRKIADIWFGEADPIGQSISIFTFDYDTINRQLYKRPQTLMVSAVMENTPRNSHLQLNVLTNFSTLPPRFLRANGADFITYFRFNKLVDKNLADRIEQINAGVFARLFNDNQLKETIQTLLMPIGRIHLHSNYPFDLAVTTNFTFVLTLGIVAALVLLIASINFINLSTARAEKRKREVGVRKTVGSSRLLLMAQFTGEAILASLLALTISFMLLELLINPFNNLLNTHLALDYKENILFFLAVLMMSFGVGFIGGIYPALYISRFSPLAILRGISKTGRPSSFIKSTLVVFQFGIASFLVFGLLVINRQIEFMKHKDLGFDQENVVLFLGLSERLIESYKALTNEIKTIPEIVSVSAAQSYPSASLSGMNLAIEGADPSQAISVKEHRVQDNYIETMRMQIVHGRDFIPDSKADDEGYIINETAALMLGLENPIDTRVVMWRRPGKIIGVIKDYHFASLRNNIEPLVISRYNPRMNLLTIRLSGANQSQALKSISDILTRYDPNHTPSYKFLSDLLQKQYGSEERTFRLILSASIIALILSMVGLYALSAYSLANRTKELGIRKILGASINNLIKLLFSETTKCVLVANIVALPIGWLVANGWLNDFAYRVEIKPWVYAASAISTYLIAIITIAWQVNRAARNNPVEALRYE